jgi:hypothetical protein
VSEPLARTLIPPRPNLGPEPWTKAPALDPLWLLTIIPVAGLVIWALGKRLRRGFSRAGKKSATSLQPDTTPRGRLVALSMSTKNALAARFGSNWRAKTTQELAIEPMLAELLGSETLGELITFLDRIDRLKFASEQSVQIGQPLEVELADWSPRIAALITRIEAKSNGRNNRHTPRDAHATGVQS